MIETILTITAALATGLSLELHLTGQSLFAFMVSLLPVLCIAKVVSLAKQRPPKRRYKTDINGCLGLKLRQTRNK